MIGECVGDLGENGVAVKDKDGFIFVVAPSLVVANISYSIPYAPDGSTISADSVDPVVPDPEKNVSVKGKSKKEEGGIF